MIDVHHVDWCAHRVSRLFMIFKVGNVGKLRLLCGGTWGETVFPFCTHRAELKVPSQFIQFVTK